MREVRIQRYRQFTVYHDAPEIAVLAFRWTYAAVHFSRTVAGKTVAVLCGVALPFLGDFFFTYFVRRFK